MSYTSLADNTQIIGTAGEVLANGTYGIPQSGDVILTDDPAGAGVTQLFGTANQILTTGSTGSVTLSLSPTLSLQAATFSGTVAGQAATFALTLGVTGNFTGTTATLSGLLTGQAATFSTTVSVTGNLSGSTASLSGLLSGTTGTFSSTLAVTGNFTGTTATLSGLLTAQAATFSSTVGVTGAFTGTSAALSTTLNVTGLSTLATLTVAGAQAGSSKFTLNSGDAASSRLIMPLFSYGGGNRYGAEISGSGQDMCLVLANTGISIAFAMITRNLNSRPRWVLSGIQGGTGNEAICVVASNDFVGFNQPNPQSQFHVSGTSGSMTSYGSMATFDNNVGAGLAFGYDTTLDLATIYSRSTVSGGKTMTLNSLFYVTQTRTAINTRAPQSLMHIIDTTAAESDFGSLTIDNGSLTTGLGGVGLTIGFNTTYSWMKSRTAGGSKLPLYVNNGFQIDAVGGIILTPTGGTYPPIIAGGGITGAIFATNQTGFAAFQSGNYDIRLGYDTSLNYAWLSCMQQGTGYRPFSINGNMLVRENGATAAVSIGTTLTTSTLALNAPSTNYGSTGSLYLRNGNYDFGMGINTSSNYAHIFTYQQTVGSLPLRINSFQTDDNTNGAFCINGLVTNFGSGIGVLFIQNASTIPTTNPTNGALLYATGGVLWQRTSAGVAAPI